MADKKRILWVNGSFLEESDAFLPAESRGLMYGAGCFETLVARFGKFLHLDRHLQRLGKGVDYLGLGDETVLLNEQHIRSVLMELLQKNKLSDALAVVRIQISLGGGRGYSVSDTTEFHMVISADPAAPTQSSTRLMVSNTRTVPGVCRPSGMKLSNALHYMKALQTAQQAGFDDAVLLSTNGYLAETAISNLFWMKKECIYTPEESCDLLPGITRGICMALIEQNLPENVESGCYTPEVLKDADIVWTTNAGRGILPVSQIDAQLYTVNHPFFDRLSRAFGDYSHSMLK